MENENKDRRMGITIAIAVFVALIVDGMDLQMLSLSLPLLQKDFGINKILAGALGTYTLFGMGVGGLIAGWFSDRIGRVKVTIASIATFSIMTAVLGFTQNYTQFAVVRFLSGVGIAALYSIGTMLVAEYVPTNRRTTILGMLQAGWSVGYILAALASSYILPHWGWRPMFIMSIVPAIFSIVLMWNVKEPTSYVAARKSTEGKKISIWNEILSNPTHRKYFILWTLGMVTLQFGYYGANTWLPSYLAQGLGINLKNVGWYVAATYLAMVFGKILAGWLSDIFGRKIMWVVSGLGTAIALPLIMVSATPITVPYLLIIFGFFYGAPYAILATYISESFPTKIRGTAVASTNAIGRAGSMLSPLMIGIVAEKYSIGYGIALMGISYALTALIPGLFIREKMYDPKSTVELPANNLNIAAAPASGKSGSGTQV